MTKSILRLLAAAVALGFAAQVSAADPVTEITITTDKMTFLYDIKEFTVKAGTKVKITLVVPKEAIPQPHNIIIIKPGKEAAVVQQAMALMADPKGLAKGYLPDDRSHIVAASKMINPGSTDILEFKIPDVAGEYPYLCTFPGHFALMKGKMTVVK